MIFGSVCCPFSSVFRGGGGGGGVCCPFFVCVGGTCLPYPWVVGSAPVFLLLFLWLVVWPVPGMWVDTSSFCCFIRCILFRADAPFLCVFFFLDK